MLQLLRSLFFFALTTMVLSAAPESSAGELAATFSLPPAPNKDIGAVIATASAGRGWVVKEASPGKTVLYLNRNERESTLTLIYTTSEIKIYSDSYKLKEDGSRSKKEIPKGWVNYLRGDILTQINAGPVSK